MASLVDEKLAEGEAALSKRLNSIELARRFPVKGGVVRPPETNWFKSIKPAGKNGAGPGEMGWT